MAYRIIWSEKALSDIEAIAEYIAKDSLRYASNVVRKILRSVRILQDFPMSGKSVREFADPNIRELQAAGYRVIYRVASREQVVVLSVLHARRNLTEQP